MDLNTAVMVLSSQTLDQAKNWFVFIEDTDEWVCILESPLMLNAFRQEVNAKTHQEKKIEPPPRLEPVSQSKPEVVPEPIASQSEPSFVPQQETLQETVVVPLSSIEHFEQLPFETDNSFNENTSEPLPEPGLELESKPEIQGSHEASLFNEEVVFSDESEPAFEEDVMSLTDAPNKRAHPRYEIKLRVIIKSEKNTFLAFTKDVSLGGLNLLSTIPDHILNGEAEIYITAPDQKNNIMFTCSPVISNTAKTRIQFTNVDPGKLKMLSAWLDHFVISSQKKAVS